IEQTGIKAKIASVSVRLLGTALSMAFTFGISLIIQTIINAISNYINREAKARESAIKYAKAIEQNISSLEDYRTQALALRKELDSGNLSLKEAASKRSELIRIQKEIIEKYGQESNAIDLVNGSINDQINVLKKLEAQDFLGAESSIRRTGKPFIKRKPFDDQCIFFLAGLNGALIFVPDPRHNIFPVTVF
ncbi:MAG: hypothetical protein ACOX8Q_03940, partial [Christensenellales bacterium]